MLMFQELIVLLSVKVSKSYNLFKLLGVLMLMNGLILIGTPGTTASLTLRTLSSTVQLVEAGLTLEQEFSINFTDCEVGDMFQKNSHM